MTNRVFEPRLYQDVHAVSKHLLTSARIDTVEDTIRDRMIYRIEKEILTERVASETHCIEENPTYDSPRHAFLASLPKGCFRQRFLMYFWGIEPPFAKKVTHEVTVKRWVNLPEQGIPQQSIEESMAYWV